MLKENIITIQEALAKYKLSEEQLRKLVRMGKIKIHDSRDVLPLFGYLDKSQLAEAILELSKPVTINHTINVETSPQLKKEKKCSTCGVMAVVTAVSFVIVTFIHLFAA